MNFAEGFRRIFKVFGIAAALAVIVGGASDQPSAEQAARSAKYDILTVVGERTAAAEGRASAWYAHQIEDAWYPKWSDVAIVETWCAKEPPQRDARIAARCAEYRQDLDGMRGTVAWHWLKVAGGAGLAYCFFVLLHALLAWIGRGFTQASARPPSA